MRALRDSNLPKFVARTLGIFLAPHLGPLPEGSGRLPARLAENLQGRR